MIDWLTLSIPTTSIPAETLASLSEGQDRLIRVGGDGLIRWEKPCHVDRRSDSHRLTISLGSYLTIMGTPARIFSRFNDNVFGPDDIQQCALAMINTVSNEYGQVPHPKHWRLTRLDYTYNYFLGSPDNVRQALEALRCTEGGRYQVRTDAETIYWSPKSAFRSGKAYAKGPHVVYQQKRSISALPTEHVQATNSLLRLELSLRRHYWSRQAKKRWYEYTPDDFKQAHNDYFSKLIGNLTVSIQSDLQKHIRQTAVDNGYTKTQGTAAYSTWLLIKEMGHAHVRQTMARSTYYRHKKILLAAGLSYTDFSNQKVVPIRSETITLGDPVNSWNELLSLVA